MDSENKNQKSKRSGRLFVAALIILGSLMLVSAVLVGVSMYKNYVLYPRFDRAVANALEPKFDLGTKFDAFDMKRRGSAELVLTDVDGLNDLGVGLNYGKGGISTQITTNGNSIDAILTRKGFALRADGVESGGYYGIVFDSITDDIDASFLNPENNSDYAMAVQKYEELRVLIFQLEDIAESKSEYAGNAKTLLDAFAKAHEQSPLYSEEHLRGEMVINGESRFARGVVYSFDHKSLMGYLDALSGLFAEPSDELRAATERIICSGIIKYEIERLVGKELSECEDVARTIDSLARLIDVFFAKSEWSASLTVAYVKNALSAIELSIDMKKSKTYALADFGIDPIKDKSMRFIFERDVLDSNGDLIKAKDRVLEYDAEKQGGAEITYSLCEEASDGTLDKEAYVLSLELDEKNDNARVAFEKRVEYYHPWAAKTNGESQEMLLDKSFAVKDRRSSISFTSYDGSYIILSRRADKVRLPRYENILTMDTENVDALFDAFYEKYGWLAQRMKKQK